MLQSLKQTHKLGWPKVGVSRDLIVDAFAGERSGYLWGEGDGIRLLELTPMDLKEVVLKCGDPCVVQAVKAINESVAQVVINVSYGVLETCNYRFSNTLVVI